MGIKYNKNAELREDIYVRVCVCVGGNQLNIIDYNLGFGPKR